MRADLSLPCSEECETAALQRFAPRARDSTGIPAASAASAAAARGVHSASCSFASPVIDSSVGSAIVDSVSAASRSQTGLGLESVPGAANAATCSSGAAANATQPVAGDERPVDVHVHADESIAASGDDEVRARGGLKEEAESPRANSSGTGAGNGSSGGRGGRRDMRNEQLYARPAFPPPPPYLTTYQHPVPVPMAGSSSHLRLCSRELHLLSVALLRIRKQSL